MNLIDNPLVSVSALESSNSVLDTLHDTFASAKKYQNFSRQPFLKCNFFSFTNSFIFLFLHSQSIQPLFDLIGPYSSSMTVCEFAGLAWHFNVYGTRNGMDT